MTVELICVGTELLLGNIVNTNAAYMSEKCALLGLSMYYQSVVGDNPGRLKELLETAKKRSDIIILCGGLGPTQDDLTKETAAEVMGKQLVLDEKAKADIQKYLSKRHLTITENNWKQALVPEGSIVLYNENGTAPGIIIEGDGNTMILLPGPPNELIPMFEQQVYPYLHRLQPEVICSKMVPIEEELYRRFGNKIYTDKENETLEEVIGKLLAEYQLTVTTAESCTGGLLAGRLVNVPGISANFKEGYITYANEAKEKLLGVSHKTLETYGAVSEETAREMALGCKQAAGADIGIGITGIAGPDGGTPEKPVGLVYIGCCCKDKTYVERFVFTGNRSKVRESSVAKALTLLREAILNEVTE